MYSSLLRIQAFLKEEEVPDWVSSLKKPDATSAASRDAFDSRLGCEGASFQWEKHQEEPEKPKPDLRERDKGKEFGVLFVGV